ncbi:hypothetical protein [Gimesia maris]|uniref:hypothetical protein n=1 Tax=Gimesia maris TaxID=122 RepID=UPI0032EAD86D
MKNEPNHTSGSDGYIASLPQFDLGEFRWTVARYIKRLIQARQKSDPHFFSQEELQRWRLGNIADASAEDWQLLQLAAQDLGQLNREFLPRCGSGGVEPVGEETPLGRLILNVAFLTSSEGGGPDHNKGLVDASEELKAEERIDWEALVDWGKLPSIRHDLDQLPESRLVQNERAGKSLSVIDSIRQNLRGQSLKLFDYLIDYRKQNGCGRVSYCRICEDEKVHNAFKKDSPGDETIDKALKRLRHKLEADAAILPYVEITIGTDYVILNISKRQI